MEESVSYGLPGSDIRLQKKALRAMMRVREADFLSAGEADVQAAAGRIFSKIEARPEFASAHCVLVYMSIRGEVPTSAFLARWSGVKRLVIPRVAGDSLELCEYRPSMLVSGYKGILEPSEAAPAVPPSEIDFALIPGVAFAWMKSPAGLSFPNENSGSGNFRPNENSGSGNLRPNENSGSGNLRSNENSGSGNLRSNENSGSGNFRLYRMGRGKG